tara:strand:+ start:3596 stop:4405 length:810 start_codon:yes stop_codon:yes gene_type:complete
MPSKEGKLMFSRHQIHPSSIRVWRGFRNEKYAADREGFVSKLEDVFIPLTCQAMMPIGLRSYIPTLLNSSSADVPDEVALVGYADQDTYYAASRNTVIGKAYGMLHYEVFSFDSTDGNPASQSAFPVFYPGNVLKRSQPYFFSGKSLDWSDKTVSLFVIPTRDNMPACEQLSARLASSLVAAVARSSVSEAILVDDPGCLTIWIATNAKQTVPPDIQSVLSTISGVITSVSVAQEVPHMWAENEAGIKVSDNETLNLKLESSSSLRSVS